MMANRTWEEWIARYETSHQHPVNRAVRLGSRQLLPRFSSRRYCCGTPVGGALPAILFAGGWTQQFIGHAFEGKPPEFFHDYRFLFVGVRWWLAKNGLKPPSQRL
jgi:hypothetical protein